MQNIPNLNTIIKNLVINLNKIYSKPIEKKDELCSPFLPVQNNSEDIYLDFEEESKTTEAVNIKSPTGETIVFKPANLDISYDEKGNLSVKKNYESNKKLAVIIDSFNGDHGYQVMNFATDDIKNNVDILAFSVSRDDPLSIMIDANKRDNVLANLVTNIKSGNLDVDAINMSMSDRLKKEDDRGTNYIKTLTEDLGVEVFIAAGNQGEGTINGLIALKDGTLVKNEHLHLVGATDANGKIQEYSSETEHVTDHAQGSYVLQRTEDKDRNIFYTDGDIVFVDKDYQLNTKEKLSLANNEARLKIMLSDFQYSNSLDSTNYAQNLAKLKENFESLYDSCTGYDKEFSGENSNGYIANSDTFLNIKAILDSGENPASGEIEARLYLEKENRGDNKIVAQYKRNGETRNLLADLDGKKNIDGTSFAAPTLMNMYLKGEMPEKDTAYFDTDIGKETEKESVRTYLKFIESQKKLGESVENINFYTKNTKNLGSENYSRDKLIEIGIIEKN